MIKAPTMSSLRPKPKDTRPSASKRGYGARWRRIRKNHLAGEPLCRECKSMNKITAATVVDHIIPHKGDRVLFYAPDNWQSLCKGHHDIKTATEDGGFGHKVKEA
jgi:5-methylcytosine-specific restriction protein A